jgi:diguanylate cyclase (GGDEF)-like protein
MLWCVLAILVLATPAAALAQSGRTAAERCIAAIESAPDSVGIIAESGMLAATSARDERSVAYLTLCRGYGREQAGNELAAIEDYEFGVSAGRRLDVDDLLAHSLVLRGEIEYNRGDFRRAVQDLDESYKLFQELGNTAKVRYTLNAMANLYADRRSGQFERALEYYRQLLPAYQADKDDARVAVTHFNIASTLESMNRFEEALVEYRRGLALDQKRGDATEVAEDRRAIGVALYKAGRPGEALRELDLALRHFVETKDTSGTARTRLSRGITLRMLKRTSESIADLEAAHAHYRPTGNRRYLEKIHEERAIAYAEAGRFRDAHDARVEQLSAQRALEADAREEQGARLRVQFESEKKDQDNVLLARENARVRRLQLAVIVLAGIIIAALAAFIARQVLAARRLRMLAMVDELTQVPNRRAIMHLAEDEVRAARSGGAGFSLLALDIDHFKQINDRFGHDVGDRVLRKVVDACRLALRPGDHMGRTGGEEFMVILPGASADAATEVAERLRASVASAELGDVAAGLKATVSVGAAVWSNADRSAAEVLSRADGSLYEVKRSGRNQVLLAAR